jgi:putative flippase GtrA
MIFIKFLAVGGVNTLVYYLLYALGVFVGLGYVVAVVIATIITMFVSFKTFGSLVFQDSNNAKILRFIGVTLLNTVLNIVGIYILKEFGCNSYTAGFFTTIAVAINSFVLNRYFVFAPTQG